jgi:hypothetical protein
VEPQVAAGCIEVAFNGAAVERVTIPSGLTDDRPPAANPPPALRAMTTAARGRSHARGVITTPGDRLRSRVLPDRPGV